MKTKKLIAITGGIGSGKSFALSVLKKAGYPTLSCDQIVKELYQKRAIKRLLKKTFPSAVSGYFNLVVDKAEIARLTFNDKVKHAELTNAITPLVLKEIKKRTSKMQGLIFVEVPLLFECSYQDQFDGVLVIMRDKTARIESVKTRSNLTEEQIVARINKQVDYDKLDLSNYTVIKNNGDKESLLKTIKTNTQNL